jgi:hypothetical protein
MPAIPVVLVIKDIAKRNRMQCGMIGGSKTRDDANMTAGDGRSASSLIESG